MTHTPLVSVTMSAYNACSSIVPSVLSILGQTHRNLELIVVNDGSTDETLATLQQIHDPRLRVYTRCNVGLTHSLNFAISCARGEFIARQDADDISLAHRLETQLAILDSNPDIDVIGSSTFVTNSRGTYNEILTYPSDHNHIIDCMYTCNPMVHGSVVIRKSLLKTFGFYNENYRYVQDYELWCRLAHKTRFYNIQEPLYCRSRLGSCSESTIDKHPIFDEIRARFILENPEANDKGDSDRATITSRNAYPVLAHPRGAMLHLGQTYARIAELARSSRLPWVRYRLAGLFYYPLFCFHFKR